MEKTFFMEKRYDTIIAAICTYWGIGREELKDILKEKELKYLFFLLLEKYKCSNLEIIKEDLHIKSNASIRHSVKKAEEKLFTNREFRERYFELEEMTKKII